MSRTTGKKKPHLSHTQLEMYWRCGEQYRRRYVEHEILAPGIALLEGRAVHAGAEFNFRQKIETHEDLGANEIVDAAVSDFETEVAGGYVLTPEEHNRGAGIVIGEAKDATANLARLHAQTQAPAYQPIAVEQPTHIKLADASHDLYAITDLRDDRRRVVDFKNVKRMPAQAEVDGSTQLTIYSAAYMADVGELPAQVGVDALVKTKTPKRATLWSRRTMVDLEVLACRINATLDALQKGVFTPCPMGAWNCSPKWCGYWLTCPFVNAERQAAAEGE